MPNVTQLIPLPSSQAPRPRSDEECVLEELGEEDGQIALTICERLATEPTGLTTIACQVRGWGDGKDLDRARDAARQFYRWRTRSPTLSRIYARAMQSRAHVIAHMAWEEIESEPDPHMARVKLDAIKWLSAKFNRADFGDEPTQPGVQVTINNDAGSNALDEIRQRLARKRRQLATIEAGPESMLTGPGGRVERGGEGEGEGADPPHTPPSRT
jgi:hypothetical protein